MSALMHHAQHTAGNVGNQLQRTAGHVGNQLQTTTNRLLPPQQREKIAKDAHKFANGNPKLAACYTHISTLHHTDFNADIPRRSSNPHRRTPLPLCRLRPHNPPHLTLNLPTPRLHHRLHLHLLRRWHRTALPHTHALLR